MHIDPRDTISHTTSDHIRHPQHHLAHPHTLTPPQTTLYMYMYQAPSCHMVALHFLSLKPLQTSLHHLGESHATPDTLFIHSHPQTTSHTFTHSLTHIDTSSHTSTQSHTSSHIFTQPFTQLHTVSHTFTHPHTL